MLLKHRWSTILLLVGLVLLTGIPVHSTAERARGPVGARGIGDTHAVTPTGSLAPFLDIVPSQDGTALYVSAGGVGELGGRVFANIGVGPGHDKGSYTMTYSDTNRSYVATAVGFTPETGASGPINITTTLGLDSGVVEFNRAYVPLTSTVQTVQSMDGRLEMTLVSTGTLPSETYIAVVPSYALPGPAPMGHRPVGSAYSVRAAGALLTADKPMSLRMHYDEATLVGADPHTLSTFAWNAYQERWEELGGRLFYDGEYLSVTTSRFTTYALMATTTWRDDFDDLNGLRLPECDGVTLSGTSQERTLELEDALSEGVAVSKVITPTATFAAWDTLVYTATADPPTTTLTVDVLDVGGAEVLTDVASGTSLDALDPAQHPALRLRANLSSTTTGQSPSLSAWRLSWRVEEHTVYLPVVLR